MSRPFLVTNSARALCLPSPMSDSMFQVATVSKLFEGRYDRWRKGISSKDGWLAIQLDQFTLKMWRDLAERSWRCSHPPTTMVAGRRSCWRNFGSSSQNFCVNCQNEWGEAVCVAGVLPLERKTHVGLLGLRGEVSEAGV